jgi:hypothetical protein
MSMRSGVIDMIDQYIEWFRGWVYINRRGGNRRWRSIDVWNEV